MAKVNLETFRCSITVKGTQCPCEFTLANAFTYDLKSLVSKNHDGVTLRTIAQNAICPWHARFLANLRKDIRRMDNVLSIVKRMIKQARREWNAEQYWLEWHDRISHFKNASMPAMAQAMKVAGVGREWPPRQAQQ